MSQNPFGNNPYGAPQNPGGPIPSGTVKNWLVESIVLLVCCAGILAIPAIVYAAQVNGKLAAGDYQGAVQCSKNAKLWCIIALCVGLACNLGIGIFYAVMVASQVKMQQM